MDETKRLSSGRAVIYLTYCALHSRCPEPKAIESMEFDKVYHQASRHSMLAITYMAIDRFIKEYPDYELDKELIKRWRIAHSQILQRLVFFDMERQALLDFLEKNRIWYMQMKGAVMQNYYPRLGMRQMSDNDILIDPERREEIRDYMLSQGDEIVYYGVELPDTYKKDGTKFYFEMHHALFFNIKRTKTEYDYYANVKDRLVKVDGNQSEYQFTDEDFYIYLITHAYKHFKECGVGIRSLMDTYIYRKTKGESLNFEYIDAELQKLGLSKFESISSMLAKIMFETECEQPDDILMHLSDAEKQMLRVHILSGTFGTAEQNTQQFMRLMDANNEITFGARVKYFMSRIFPGLDYYKLNHPFVYKTKILIPFWWCWRLIRGIFRNPKVNSREMHYIWKSK